MATRAELFASGELKSPLNVKEKVIKTLRDAAEEGGGSGGGGGVMKINLNVDLQAHSIVSDKSYNDIANALNGGSIPYAFYDLGSGTQWFVAFVSDMRYEAPLEESYPPSYIVNLRPTNDLPGIKLLAESPTALMVGEPLN